ncbi:MAG: glutaredoxin family protein [Actinomycetota bacterium]|nr:glutaredoxin family protein [Actinomycetota bacterium]
MTITVYSTPGCSQCVMTKNWLVRKGITFHSVDLSTSPEDLAVVQALGYASAPVVIVNDDGDTKNEKHWYGFRPDLLEEFTLIKEAA